ncbi:hypothetical protein EfmJHP35_07610 [Enterococcus faecium]|nr:hypothetical protein EfmJHP35_07610 [Enterococcus faecium]
MDAKQFTMSITFSNVVEHEEEFGHLEGDTIVGIHHKRSFFLLRKKNTLKKDQLKVGPQTSLLAVQSEPSLVQSVPKNLFKSITFDCGKEFSNWKSISNTNDIDIYFADPGTPSQRGLNEHSNGLLRKDGLPKEMEFNQVNQGFISSVASKRNHIPRKSLNYQTPLEVFLSYVNGKFCLA